MSIDWEGLERDLVHAYAAKVKALRRRLESEVSALEADGQAALAAVEDAVRKRRSAPEDATPLPPRLGGDGGGLHAPPPPPERPSYEAATVVPVTKKHLPPPKAPDPWGDEGGKAVARPPSGSQPAVPAEVAHMGPGHVIGADTAAGSTPAAPPPPPPTAATAALSALPGIAALLGRLEPPLPEDMTGFLGLAGEAFARMSPEDQAGERGTKVLTDCVRLLDALAQDLDLLPGAGAAREAAERVAGSLVGICERERGCTFFPSRAIPAAEARRRYGEGAVESVPLPAREPEGAALRIVERGLVAGGKPRRRARVHESAGREHPLGSRYLEARGLIARLPPDVAVGARTEAARSLERLAAESLTLATPDARAVSLRYALNALVPIERDRVLAPVLDALRADLRALGVEQMDVRIGERFGEGYGPDRYERRTVASGKLAGTIVQVFQPGFVNRDGICIQKAILGVAG